MHRNFCASAKVNSFFLGCFASKWNQNVLTLYFIPAYSSEKLNSVLDSAEGSKDNMGKNKEVQVKQEGKKCVRY